MLRAMRVLHTALLAVFALPLLACGGTSANAPAPAEPTPEPAAEPATEPPAEPAPSSEPVAAEPASPAKPSDEPAADEAHPPGLTVEETRTQQVIQDTFMRNRPQVRACFDQVLQKHPGLKGNLTVSFVLDPKGKVKQASINTARSDLAVPELNTCVIEKVLQIQFPPSSRGFESQGNYPFNFNPK